MPHLRGRGPRRPVLRGGRRGADEAHGAPEGAARGVPPGLRGRGGPAGVEVRRADEEALRHLMAFWQLTVASSPETRRRAHQLPLGAGRPRRGRGGDAARVPRGCAPSSPRAASSTALLTAVRAYCASLRSLGFRDRPPSPRSRPLLDEAWASAWQQSFPAARGRGAPPRAAAVGRADLAAQRRAWSSSSSPAARSAPATTAAPRAASSCSSARSRTRPGARVLDIGTGTGILAIAAVKLGAAGVLAIDVDPDATVRRARPTPSGTAARTASRSPLAGPETLAGDAFPLVVANLLTHTHLALAPVYARLVAPGGALVLGGILAEEDAAGDAAPLEPAGFVQRDRLVARGMVVAAARSPRRSARVTRFLVHAESAAGERVSFDADEAHHLARVLRLASGRPRAGGRRPRPRADRAARPRSARTAPRASS